MPRTGPPTAVNVQAQKVASQLQELGVDQRVTRHVGESLHSLAMAEALLAALKRIQLLESTKAISDADA